jgi:Tfp pilus assembly protein PilF
MPHPAAAKVGLALCHAKTDQLSEAKKLLYDVIALDLGSIQESYAAVAEPMERFTAAAELGKMLVNEGEFTEGLRLLDLALKSNSRDQSARYVRAMALRGLNRDDEAKEELKRVEEVKNAFQKVNALRNQIGRDPGACLPRVELGKLLIEYESERNGLFWLQSAIEQDPECFAAQLALAEYYESHLHDSPEYAELAKSHREKAKASAVKDRGSGERLD